MTATQPKLDGLNLVVGDMDATVGFYRLLGLEIPEETIWRTESGPHHVEVEMADGLSLDFDSAELARGYNSGFGASQGGVARTLIGFSVGTREAVDECYASLVAAGHAGLQPPYDAFWGARYAIVEDPDGRQVGIMSPSDPDRRSAPPVV